MAGHGASWGAERDGLCALPIRRVAPIPWTRRDDRVTIHLPHQDVDFRPRVTPILEALDGGDTDLPALVDALLARDPDRSRRSAARSARFLVRGLEANGLVEVALPPAPDALAGRYALERELGRGGVGVVWLARDLEAGGPVVVKHAWNWTGPLANRDAAIREEARTMARLDHPRVVRALDLVDHEGRAHLVRTYVDGRVLGSAVFHDGPPAPPARLAWTGQAASILAHLHRRGVLCLDVTPGNFMLQDGGALALADLSHCRVAPEGELALKGALGTRSYMAPEVARGEVALAASDVYGLGRFHASLVLGRELRATEAGDGLLRLLEDAGATAAELALVADCCREDPAARPGAAAVATRVTA